MKLLVADISNGRTKLALACGGTLVSGVRVLPTADVTQETLQTACADWEYAAAVLCSVVPEAAAAEAFFVSRVPVMRVCASAELPVDFSGYEGVATLGADRVANAVAAAQLFPDMPLAVIDAGTATTVDVVLPAERAGERKPRFLGGAIAPGVGTMVRSLHRGTAQLPTVPLAVPSHAVGRNTVEALQNGCVRAYRGLLRELLQGMEKECGCRLHPVLTGGDAPLLAALMPELGTPEPLLTLRGIARCAEENEKC